MKYRRLNHEYRMHLYQQAIGMLKSKDFVFKGLVIDQLNNLVNKNNTTNTTTTNTTTKNGQKNDNYNMTKRKANITYPNLKQIPTVS